LAIGAGLTGTVSAIPLASIATAPAAKVAYLHVFMVVAPFELDSPSTASPSRPRGLALDDSETAIAGTCATTAVRRLVHAAGDQTPVPAASRGPVNGRR